MTEHHGWSVVPNWVVRANRLQGSEKLLYIALLNRANKRGECWPSLSTLCDDVGVSRRTVISKLIRLEELGLIEKVKRRNADGANASNLYRVLTWDESQADTPAPSAEPSPPGANGALGVVQTGHWGSANGTLEVLHSEVLPNEVLPNKSEVAIATRPEVSYLLDLLDDLIEANGSKRPKRNKANRDAARLLLDKDGRTVEEAEMVIRWSQQDHFWRANILSMVKLREKFDQMRLRAVPKQRPAEVGLDLVREYQSLEQQEISC